MAGSRSVGQVRESTTGPGNNGIRRQETAAGKEVTHISTMGYEYLPTTKLILPVC